MLDLKGTQRFSMAELGLGSVDSRTVWRYLRAIVAMVLIAAIILASLWVSYNMGSRISRVAATPEWREALTWLRENTPEDGEVKTMTWWDYGYWIFDLAQRVPVVDNGVHWESYDRDIATVYCAEDDDEAVEIMHKHGARYLVFSELDFEVLPVITMEALGTAYGDGTYIPRELKGSLFSRSLNGQIEFGGGLRRVYPAIDIEKPSVVILALE
jgi:asparagine N-glycosylation enzyme membrane subunit Stt3